MDATHEDKETEKRFLENIELVDESMFQECSVIER